MRFTILGAGALGTILAAHLIRAGHEVTVIARGRRAATIAKDGLVVTGLSDLKCHCPVISAPSTLAPMDVLVVAVKTYQLAEAIAPYRSAQVQNVFSVANGVMKNSQLQEVFGSQKTLGCMADFSGELLGSGEVAFTRNICLYIGELSGPHGRAEPIARAINDAGVNAAALDNIETIEWSKFVGWVALMPLAVLTRLETWKYLSDPNVAQVAVNVIRETAALASVRGIEIIDQSPMPVASIAAANDDDALAVVIARGDSLRREAPTHRMSSLQDLSAGRRLEVHETLGYALEETRNAGLEAPTLATLYHLVAAIDRQATHTR